MGRLGGLKRLLEHDHVPEIIIDFSETIWADVVALINTLVVIATYRTSSSQVIADLGTTSHGSPLHRAFLKFLTTQGFLDLLGDHASLRLMDGSQEMTSLPQIKALVLGLPQETLIRNADCIKAKLIPCSAYLDRREEFRYLIDSLLGEAHARTYPHHFDGNDAIRELAFQKLRRVLHELLSNTIEHAYRDTGNGYAGLYVRVHGRRPSEPKESEHWSEILRRERQVPAISQFDPNDNADWIEVYVCDAGCGLLHDLETWEAFTDQPALKKACRKAKKAKQPLVSFATNLFRAPVSKISTEGRQANKRSNVTGLMHIDQILARDREHTRLYSEGTFIGSRHAWNPDTRGSIRPIPDRERTLPAPGTTYVVALQPTSQTISLPASWRKPSEQQLATIRDVLITTSRYHVPDQILAMDLIESVDPAPPANWRDKPPDAEVIVVRLPRTTSKNNFSEWILQWGGLHDAKPSLTATTFVVCGMTAFEMLPFADFLPKLQLPKDTQFNVVFVTNNLECAVYQKRVGFFRFNVVTSLAQRFCTGSGEFSKFGMNQLISLLREFDAITFWKGSNKTTILIEEQVKWSTRDDGTPIVVRGYLDFALALADPTRTGACRRALARSLALFPDAAPLATDDIVRSLLLHLEEMAPTGPKPQLNTGNRVLVGSVCVTSSTIKRYRRIVGAASSTALAMLVHPDAVDADRVLPVLAWQPEPPISASTLGPHLQLERISKTPFVGRGGDRAIRIVRFKPDDGRQVFAESFFPRSPAETYADFSEYGIMRTGHWRYGTRHELLTINLSKAIDLSFVENGELFQWLSETLTELLNGNAVSSDLSKCILVYPSHDVTDKLMTALYRDRAIGELLRSRIVIPIRTTGPKTVSPILISPHIGETIRSAANAAPHALAAVIIDDGVVTGKHLREIEEFLRENGVATVNTVALLDRYGSPTGEVLMSEYVAKNRRFWRWDVPSLGHRRDCLLCAALGFARDLMSRVQRPTLAHRLQQWLETWSARDVDKAWDRSGIKPIQFMRPMPITFGFEIDDFGHVTKNKIDATNSTSLAAIFLELTRLTTRYDVPLRKVEQLLTEQSDPALLDAARQAALEILATQFLLFYDELDEWQKQERLVLIFRLLWANGSDSDASALGALCIASASEDIVEDLLGIVWDEAISNASPQSIDALIALHILYSKSNSGGERIDQLARNRGGVRNALLAGLLPDLTIPIANMFATIGSSSRAGHQTPLRRKLLRLASRNGFDAPSARADIRIVEAEIVKLTRSLQALAAWGPLSGIDSLEVDISQLRKAMLYPDSSAQLEVMAWAGLTQTLLFGSDAIEGLAQRYRSELLQEFDRDSFVARSLYSTWTRVFDQWDAIAAEKLLTRADIAWRDPHGKIRKPVVRCGNTATWSRRITLFWDRSVRDVLAEVASNVVHATGRITNPWSNESLELADIWWTATENPESVAFQFVNATERSNIRLATSFAIANLERMGGSLAVEVSNGSAVVTVAVPMLAAFVEG